MFINFFFPKILPWFKSDYRILLECRGPVQKSRTVLSVTDRGRKTKWEDIVSGQWEEIVGNAPKNPRNSTETPPRLLLCKVNLGEESTLSIWFIVKPGCEAAYPLTDRVLRSHPPHVKTKKGVSTIFNFEPRLRPNLITPNPETFLAQRKVSEVATVVTATNVHTINHQSQPHPAPKIWVLCIVPGTASIVPSRTGHTLLLLCLFCWLVLQACCVDGGRCPISNLTQGALLVGGGL